MSGIVLTGLDGDDEGSRILRRALAIEATQRCGLLAARQLAAEQVRAEDRAAKVGERPSRADPKRLLTVAEVAKELGVPRNRVYEMTKSGTLPCVRIDTSVRVRRDVLDDFIARGGTNPRDE